MARLPQPGGDNGNWGNILNDFLSQTLDTNGKIKDNAVTSNTIAPNSITNAAIASDAVNTSSIANGSITNSLIADGVIQEAKLSSAVQTKLNAGASPDWSAITNKPAVIGAGATEAAARAAIDLDNVDNTADTAKPVSTAQQTALDTKLDKQTSSVSLSVYTVDNVGTHSVRQASSGTTSTGVIVLRGAGGAITGATPTNPTDVTNKTYVDTADALKANDSNVVHKTGSETVAGQKTFTSALIVGDGTGSTSLAIQANNYNGVATSIYSATASAYSFFNRYRGTISSPSQVLSGDFIGSFGFRAANETGAANSQDAARISALAEEDIASTNQKSALILYTSPNNSITTYERLRISGSGNITIGSSADQGSGFSVNRQQTYSANGKVTTNGTTTLTGTGTTFTNTFRVGDLITVSGETVRTITTIASDTSLTVSVAFATTASNVSYAASNGFGLFRVQTNGNIGINQNNPQSRLHFTAGTTAADGIQFGTDTTLYRSAADTLKTDDNIIVGTPGTASGSVVTIDGNQTLTNKTITTPRMSNILDSSGNTAISINATASAVNYIFLVNGATGNTVSARAVGADTNIGWGLFSKGTGAVSLRSDPHGFILQGTAVASTANYFTMTSGAAGSPPRLGVDGTDTNSNLNIFAKGTGTVRFGSDSTVPASKSLSIYNTGDETTNYERVRQYWSGNMFYISAENGGTGTARDMMFGSSGNGLTVSNGSTKNIINATTGSSTGVTLSVTGTLNALSGTQQGLRVANTINQSGTAGYTAFTINATETSTGSGTKLLMDAQVGGASKFSVDNTGKVSISGTAATFSSGTGSPEGAVVAPVGSLYTRTDGGAGTTLYVKESGAGNTGWVAK